MPEKTVATRMVEGLLTTMLGSVVENAQRGMPPLKLAPDGEPITAMSILEQIRETLQSDPKSAMRLALTLGAFLARQEGVSEKDALMAAGLAWGQTSGLTAR